MPIALGRRPSALQYNKKNRELHQAPGLAVPPNMLARADELIERSAQADVFSAGREGRKVLRVHALWPI
jgi:hypothetical protein